MRNQLHGIRIAMRERLSQVKDPVVIELPRTLKAALGPNGILNPGKVMARPTPTGLILRSIAKQCVSKDGPPSSVETRLQRSSG